MSRRVGRSLKAPGSNAHGGVSVRSAANSGDGSRPLRIAVVGISLSETCGVHAHATLLAEALEEGNVSCSLHWLFRHEQTMRGARTEIGSWLAELETELVETRPDVILFHYSVFSYSHRGVPVFVHETVSHLCRSGTPIVTVMHEFAYPWLYGGWRGALWAVSQRAVLRALARASAAVLVTADFRADWLASRWWLPRRPVAVAPVFSNLPAPLVRSPPTHARPLIGLFGYSYQGAAVALTLDALQILRGDGVDAELKLLGAPGPGSSAAQAWLDGARERRLSDRLAFSGALAAQDLSDALAGCDVLLFVDTSGPSSRKGTLAGSLASGRPVVALDGPRRWSELIEHDAAAVADQTPEAFAAAIGRLLADEMTRDALGARGREFAQRRMGIGRSVDAVEQIVEGLPERSGSVS